jgi:hypothetical protein
MGEFGGNFGGITLCHWVKRDRISPALENRVAPRLSLSLPPSEPQYTCIRRMSDNMATADFDSYSTALHREALRTQRKFPELNYDQSVRLLDQKAKTTQLSYGEVRPPLHGCVVPLVQNDIEAALDQGVI